MYSLLTRVTFEVLPLSSYALTPTMLPMLEINGTPVVEKLNGVFTFFYVVSILKSSSL